MTNLEEYFRPFRENVLGYNEKIVTPEGEKTLVYADWTASGRLYKPIEEKISYTFGPLIGNTHTESNITGTTMTLAYENARTIIKKHVNADLEKDILIMAGSGMTGAVNKLILILGWRLAKNFEKSVHIALSDRPIVFISMMEHHSNELPWRESIVDVEYIPYDKETCLPLIDEFDKKLEKYNNRRYKVAAITACSNVTGIKLDYHQIAKTIHKHGGVCFVDFAASAPYVSINMHPPEKDEQLDAIYFSPHKFLGGPGTPGVLIFNRQLYDNHAPVCPGGGTVKWVNPWDECDYYDGIEAREDGGTPPFIQTIKAALCIRLKEKMGVNNILKREQELLAIAFPFLKNLNGIKLLNDSIGFENRLGILSFVLKDDFFYYNLIVKLLNDHYGIQVRGGCVCAGPYGHCLLKITKEMSDSITCEISKGNSANKPGWIRLSIHPLMTDRELHYILESIKSVITNYRSMQKDYFLVSGTTDWKHIDEKPHQIDELFSF